MTDHTQLASDKNERKRKSERGKEGERQKKETQTEMGRMRDREQGRERERADMQTKFSGNSLSYYPCFQAEEIMHIKTEAETVRQYIVSVNLLIIEIGK